MVDVLAESWGFAPAAPWGDERKARSALSALACTAAGRSDPAGPDGVTASVDRSAVAAWLIAHDLGGLGFAWALSNDRELAERLRDAAAGCAAGNLGHFASLDRIERRFAADRIPMLLLKGAAVAWSVYADSAYRPMSDVDIWVEDADVPRAVLGLRALGFRQDPGLPHRPAELQRRSCGEIVFRHAGREHGLVELHYGPFQGWWIRRAACPDTAAVWRRSQPMGPERHARRLAPEDAILQTAFHVVVNQFGQAPWRGLMDLAVLSRAHRIDWDVVARRARDWRMKTATWLVLDTADRLIGLPGCGSAVSRLRPKRARRATLRAFVTPSALLSGRDLRHPMRRYAFMLSVVDRPRDAARLVARALWPERWWIAARYGRPVGRVEHLWGLVRRGEV